MKYSEKLVLLRNERKISQLQLAEQLGVSRQAISKWESGVSMPDVSNIIELSKLYDVSCDYILREDVIEKGRIVVVERVVKEEKSEAESKKEKQQKYVIGLVGFMLGVCISVIVFSVIEFG